jgi:HPt (histidine-containing phosphotransfer) domain-containing protein
LAETLERWIFDEVSEFVTSASTESLSFSSAEILDDTALARLRSLEDPKSPGFVAEIINDFLNGLTEQVERLRSAAESRDVDGLRTAAHTFKGSSASVGAELLRLVSLKIEELSTNPDGDELRFAIEELENAAFDTRRVMEALPEMVSTSSPSRD